MKFRRIAMIGMGLILLANCLPKATGLRINKDSLTYFAGKAGVAFDIPGRSWQMAFASGNTSLFLRSTRSKVKLGILQTPSSEEEFPVAGLTALEWLQKNVASQQKNLVEQRKKDGVEPQITGAKATDWVNVPNLYWEIADEKSVNATLQFIEKNTMVIVYCTSWEGADVAQKMIVQIVRSKRPINPI